MNTIDQTNQTNPVSESDQSINSVDSIADLEQLISIQLTRKASMKSELKKQKEMLESTLMNSETYRLHSENAKEAAKVKSKTKMEILKLPENMALAEKIKDMATELKDLEQSINAKLLEFTKLSGLNTIEDGNGELQEIVYILKLKKPRKEK